MLIQWYCSNRALPPQKLYTEYKKYRRKYEESYTIAFTINNFREIVNVYGYNVAVTMADTFIQLIRKYFPDGLIGTMVSGDFILVTNQSITEINQFFGKFMNDLMEKYKTGQIPVEIKFRSGLSRNDSGNAEDDLRRPVIAMLYQRSESIYVQYYSDNLEEESKEQYKYIEKLDNLMKNKKAKNIAVDIIDVSSGNSKLKELRMVDSNNKEIFTKYNIPLIEKYGIGNKMVIYNLEYILDDYEIDENNIYMINVNFSIIYKNQYLFLNLLKTTAAKKNIPTDHICLNINYDRADANTMALIYITRELKNAGFLLCLQRCGLLNAGYSLVISSAIEVDYVKISIDELIKSMNEKRLKIMLQYFINMYLELGITPIFTNVSTQGQIDFIKSVSSRCLIRKKQ